jgi:hypothetical protein
MWKLASKGESYYVNHVTCSVPWSTKETPNNSHTKGSIKVKDCVVVIDDSNDAEIRPATAEDRIRDAAQKTVRVITAYGSKLKSAIASMNHGAVKMAGGGCGTTWYITDIPSMKHFLLLQLQLSDVRVLMPNEDYYKMYDQSASTDNDWIDEDDYYDNEELYEN